MIQDDNDFGIGLGDLKDFVIVFYNIIVWGNLNFIIDQFFFIDFFQLQFMLKISYSIFDGIYLGENVMDEDLQFDIFYYVLFWIIFLACNVGSIEGVFVFDLNGVVCIGLLDIGVFEIFCIIIVEVGNDSDGLICVGDEVNLFENGGEVIFWFWMGLGGFSSNE